MRHNGVMDATSRPTYDDVIAEIAADPGAYWLTQARELIDWVREPTIAVDDSQAPIYRWFPDGELNVCFNALDRHVAAGRGEQAAIIYDSPVTDTVRTITYAELLDEVSRFARALSERGVGKGDRVVIYMPMIPEAAVAMLACARIGAIHSVVFGGFAPAELAVRIDDTAPKAVISTSAGVERNRILEYKPMLDEAISLASSKPEFSVIVQRDEHRCELGTTDLDFAELLAATPEGIDPVTVKSTDELYVLYTSGTTGKPKGIVRDSGGYAVALAYSMPHIFGLEPGDTMFTASDVGWVVGHSYIVYGPLLAGVTSVLFEGQADRHPRRRHVLPHHRRPRGQRPLHRPHGHARRPQGGPERRAHRQVRSLHAARVVPRRRTARPGHVRVDDEHLRRGDRARDPRRRQLVADGDGVADRGEPAGPHPVPAQGGLPDEARARV